MMYWPSGHRLPLWATVFLTVCHRCRKVTLAFLPPSFYHPPFLFLSWFLEYIKFFFFASDFMSLKWQLGRGDGCSQFSRCIQWLPQDSKLACTPQDHPIWNMGWKCCFCNTRQSVFKAVVLDLSKDRNVTSSELGGVRRGGNSLSSCSENLP